MAVQPKRGQRFRILGSGYTIFKYHGDRLHFCQQIQDRPPDPVAPPQAIQPLDARHPIEIAFPAAVREGTLTLVIFEEWDRDVWRQFFGFRRGQFSDLADVFDQAIAVGAVTCVKVIKKPGGGRRLVQYHGAVITNIDMSENIAIDTLTVGRTVTITYTRRVVSGG
jgi:hypothetical protein